jgi:hypothetical protein
MKKVYSYNATTGKFIKEYKSQLEASKDTNVLPQHIGAIVAGKVKQIKNFVFLSKYVGSIPPYIKNKNTKPISLIPYSIYIYSLNGKFVRKMDSIEWKSLSSENRMNFKREFSKRSIIRHKNLYFSKEKKPNGKLYYMSLDANKFTRNKYRPLIRISPPNDYIENYANLTECAIKTNLSKGKISEVLNGKKKHYKNCIYKWAD